MAAYEEQFESHALHGVLDQFDTAINQKFKHKLDDVALDNIDRLNQASKFITDRLSKSSPVLNPVVKLNNIQKNIQASLNEVNQYNSNGNSGHLTNASNQIDAAITNTATLVVLEEPTATASTKDVISFKKLAQQVIVDLQSDSEKSIQEISALTDTITSLNNELENLKGQLKSLENTASSKLDEVEARFKAEETEREAGYGEAEEKRKKEFSNLVNELNSSSDNLLSELNSKKQEAERIVQLVGNVGLTGNYKGAGENEKTAADRMRIIALLCFLGGFTVVGVTLFLSSVGEFNPWQSLFRLSAALFLLVPGTYAAKESSRHRTLENRHRRSELELATIDAYLDDLPDDERHKLKANLTEKFFGQQDVAETHVKAEVSSTSLVSLLKDAIQALSKK
jgi:hypothetical protein